MNKSVLVEYAGSANIVQIYLYDNYDHLKMIASLDCCMEPLTH